jgi:hypothetical protein
VVTTPKQQCSLQPALCEICGYFLYLKIKEIWHHLHEQTVISCGWISETGGVGLNVTHWISFGYILQ